LGTRPYQDPAREDTVGTSVVYAVEALPAAAVRLCMINRGVLVYMLPILEV
jgi:hypothetical protein